MFFSKARLILGILKTLTLTVAFFATVRPLHAEEFRAAWADVFHVGLTSQTDVNNMVATLVSGNYNAVVVQVLGYMDNSTASHGAHWKSSIVPWSSRVTASFDPLAALCTAAHANGIEVHAWLGGSAASMYRVSNAWPPAGNATLASHPEWFISPLANSENGGDPVIIDGVFALDMGSPDAQEYIVSIVKELVTNYPIDGINWDDEMNSAGYNAGFGYPTRSQAEYPRSGLARYRINTGTSGTPSNTDTAWSNYRRRYKNELIARVQAEIQSIKTNPRQPLRHTLSPIAYSPVPSSCNFVGSASYTYFTDWPTMMQNGWIDATIPQFYSLSTFSNWVDRSVSCWQYNRHVYPGIGAYLNTNASIANMIYYTRSKGLLGNNIYSYAVPNSTGTPNTWWSYAAANVYTNVATTPTMPWRNPATATEGILWGRVKDASTGLYVDDATVTVTGGPTVKTDGNGYYVATLVPATAGGTTHSTTASKTGMVAATTNALVLPGDVVRYDLVLNAGLPAAPSGLTATTAGNSQINLTWTDNATNETGFVVARGTVSGGAYSDIAALSANATSYGDTGLSGNTTYYYVVRATNNVGSSTNSGEASATTTGTTVAPAITSQPASRTNISGTTATFTVVASGTSPIYGWRKNGSALSNGGNVSGATLASLTLTSVAQSDSASYSVVVTNSAGSVTSVVATLTVIVPPAIATQPQNQDVTPGANATFTVTATGSAPLNYQWRFNGGNISGATASSYAKTNVQSGDAGSYSVVVTNSGGAATSVNAVLGIVGLQPLITLENIWNIQAGSRNYVTTGNTERGIAINHLSGHVLVASRSALLAGSLGVFILDAATGAELGSMDVSTINNTATFKLNKICVAEDGVIYGVNLTTSSGSSPLVIYRWAGESSTPVAVYSGAPDGGTTLRWGDSVAIRGRGTNTQILVAGSSSTTAIIFTTTDGTNFSANVLNPSPAIPGGAFSRGLYFGEANSFYVKNRSVSTGTNFNFSIAANSATAAFNIPGLETNMIAISVDTNRDLLFGIIDDNSSSISGHSLKAYDISTPASPIVVSNFNYLSNSSGTSSNNPNFGGAADTDGERVVALDTQNGVIGLRIVETYPPTIATNPQSAVVTQNNDATFTVSASGPAPLNYQWRFNGTNISGATQSSYTRTSAQPADAGSYSVVVTNIAGSATSSNAGLTVVPLVGAPTITTQPQSLVVTQGNNATFTAAASGNPAPGYQWRFNGTNISGATDSSYTVMNSQATNAGSYSVAASNIAGSTNSSDATLVVKIPVNIATQPQSQLGLAGSNVNFSVVATGDATLGYQWRFGGTNILGANTSTYQVFAAQASNSGNYSVIITNPVNTVTSANAHLTVVVSPVRFDSITPVIGRKFYMRGSGDPGTYQIETATNLANWSVATTLNNTNGTFEWTDPVTNLLQRYYRAKLIP